MAIRKQLNGLPSAPKPGYEAGLAMALRSLRDDRAVLLTEIRVAAGDSFTTAQKIADHITQNIPGTARFTVDNREMLHFPELASKAAHSSAVAARSAQLSVSNFGSRTFDPGRSVHTLSCRARITQWLIHAPVHAGKGSHRKVFRR